MEYNGYHAVVTFDEEIGILHGEVIDTRDVITFQGKSVDQLEQAFRASVEEYLKICEERGRVPEKPFSGRVVLRMEPSTHRAAAGAARIGRKSLNSWILDAIDRHLSGADEEAAPAGENLEMFDPVTTTEVEAFLREVSRRYGSRDTVSPVIPFWVDIYNGRMWTSDMQPAGEILTFDSKEPQPNSGRYSPFNEFLMDHVNLNSTRWDRLESAVRGVSAHLKEHLPGYQRMERQGSYALKTLIRPANDNDGYDADIQVVINPNPKWDPKDYVSEVHRALAVNETYADKLRLRTRCVTVDYAGDFHLDVVPCVTIDGKYYLCNRLDNNLEETDGAGYRDWFNDKNRITGGNLKRVVRLLKYLRDHKNGFTAGSMVLTTLAGNTIEASDEGMESVGTVADTFETVLSRMNEYLQRHPNMPWINNPVLEKEVFNRHWAQRNYANFSQRVQWYAQIATEAKTELAGEKGIELWRELFGEAFGESASAVGRGGVEERWVSPTAEQN